MCIRDRRQVDRFLERVADAFEHLIEQVRTLKGAQHEQKTRLEEYRDMEGTLRTALAASQKLTEDVLSAARREANAILEEARVAQARIDLESQQLPEGLRREIQALEQQRDRLRSDLTSIIETHRRLLQTQLPQRPAPPSLTNLGFLMEPVDSDEAPIFTHEAPLFGADLPEAVVFGDDSGEDGPAPVLEEPSGSGEALQEPVEPDTTETNP